MSMLRHAPTERAPSQYAPTQHAFHSARLQSRDREGVDPVFGLVAEPRPCARKQFVVVESIHPHEPATLRSNTCTPVGSSNEIGGGPAGWPPISRLIRSIANAISVM